jgi:hypothetical protein
MNPFTKLHQWYDRQPEPRRFYLFFFAVAVPFIVSGNSMFSTNSTVATIARIVFVLELLFGAIRMVYVHSDPTFVPRTRDKFRNL